MNKNPCFFKGLPYYKNNLGIEQSLQFEIVIRGKAYQDVVVPATIGFCSPAGYCQPGNEGNCKDQRAELLPRSKCIRCQYFIIQSYIPSSPNMKAIKGKEWGKKPLKVLLLRPKTNQSLLPKVLCEMSPEIMVCFLRFYRFAESSVLWNFLFPLLGKIE